MSPPKLPNRSATLPSFSICAAHRRVVRRPGSPFHSLPSETSSREVAADGVRQFLSYRAADREVAASTRNQASSALLFLYSACTVRRCLVVATRGEE
jgi:hypothetical protein